MIVCAQNFIRTRNDVSSVSLREIRRFNIFYEFFFEHLRKRKEMKFYTNLNYYYIQVYSIILSVYVCYYLRITDIKIREELKNELNQVIDNYEKDKKIDFLFVPQQEELYIINNIKLEKGIAKNRALLDNIFSLFVAINNKVPIFIVGKPGCSKSLSVQLINKAMKGRSSNSPLFKTLPKIILNSYQGSMGSTSKGVQKVFDLARNKIANLDEEVKKNIISMIFFDEMGLAEHSSNNPLKVIHSELEYDLNEGDKKVAFVGISNWVLDASKMNRGMLLSIPDPSKEESKETALIIGKSYDENLALNYKDFFEDFGEVYYEYKKYLIEKHNLDGKDEFHGNRDFYHLVKIGARQLVEKKNQQIEKHILQTIAVTSVERNFGGLYLDEQTTSLEYVKRIVKRKYEGYIIRKDYKVFDRIKDNINDLESRYLLTISKSSISTFLLSSILVELKKEYNFYIGSKFQNDLQSEEYSLKILNKIQLHMEQGKVLILKNLESVYPALYDLFNQNFHELGNKKFARIAIGSSTSTFSIVSDNFRCIVNVDENQILEEEPPFLNRFEKHIVTFDNLLKDELIKESKKIHDILMELIIYDKDIYKGINYDLKEIFVNSDLEEIQGIVYHTEINKKGTQDIKQEMMDFVISKISLILPQDILLLIKINDFNGNHPDISKKIIEEYNKGEHKNLSKFVEKMENTKNVVYTFNNILDVIDGLDNIDSKILDEIKKENIKDIKISSFKSENDFEREIDDFLNEKNFKLCIIRFKANEGDFLNYIKFFIENKEKEITDNKNKKAFIFIVHMTRIFNSTIDKDKKILKETISHLSGYYQIFIDDLNGKSNVTMEDMINLKGKELFEKCLNFESVLRENFYTCLSYMNYSFCNVLGKLNKEYANKLVDYIDSDKELKKSLNNCILKEMEKEENIIIQIFSTENIINQNDIDMIGVIQRYLCDLYLKYLNLIYYKAEKDQFFSTLLSNNEKLLIIENEEKREKFNKIEDEKEGEKKTINNIGYNDNVKVILEKAKKIYLEKLILIESESSDENKNKFIVEQPGANQLHIILGLELPGLKPIISSIIQKYRINVKKDYRKNESDIRFIDSDDEEAKKEYYEKLKSYNKSTYNELDKDETLSEIMKDEKDQNAEKIKKELFDLFLDDYYLLFIYEHVINYINFEKRNENDYNEIKKFLTFLVKLKIDSKKDNDEKNDIKNNVAYIINWIEGYSEEISMILNIFAKLNRIISNLYIKIEEIIERNQIEYEISKRSPSYTAIVNKELFLGIESILRIVTSNEQIYINIKDNPEKFAELININKEILQQASKIQINLSLFSKEVFSLQEFLLLYDCFNSNKKDNPDNITKLIKFFSNETNLINDKKNEELIDNFNQFYKFLEDSIGKDTSFNEIMSRIFKNEYIKIIDDSFRNDLLKKILTKDDFIYNNMQIFSLIINIDISPKEMDEYINTIQEDNSNLITILNECKNEFFEQTIINLYEYKIILFFNSIKSFAKRRDYNHYFRTYIQTGNETSIIFDLTFDIFSQCINILDKIYNNTLQNKNLCKLFAVSYIKIYLSKMVYFICKKEQEIQNISEIIRKINGSDHRNKLRKVIKIYVFKLFYNKMKRNWETFIHFNYESKQIDFYRILEEDNDLKENIYLTRYFLPFEPKKYEEYNKQFNEYKNKDEENAKKILSKFIKKNELDAFIMVSINQIISKLAVENKNVEFTKFSKICDLIFKEFKDKENLKKLLLLFFNENQYNEVIKNKIEEYKREKLYPKDVFEYLLYGFRFCIQTLSNNNLLYSSLLSSNCLDTIKKYFIPGNYPLDDNNDNKDDNNNKNIGINFISKDLFKLVQKKVRNLSEIGFRLLNFILYNHLFFANCLNYYPKDEFNKDFECIGMNCLDVIKLNWDLLDEALRKKNITSVQIFINLIFEKLSELIKNCELITKEKDLIKFENKVEKVIESSINEYPNYSEKYLEINKKLLPLKENNIRTLICELEPPEMYPYEEYPFLKYFTYTKYRTIDNLKKELGPEKDYKFDHPLLFEYLKDSNVQKLKHLQAFNDFSNIMIDNYSFNISREDAKIRIVSNEQKFQEFEQKYKSFIQSWKEIKNEAIKYQKNPQMEVIDLEKEKHLAYLLNDANEQGFGMYLASAYENFIKWQNEFLEHIIKYGIGNKNLKNYIENIKIKIPIYQANRNQIVLINDNYDDLAISDFGELINNYSKRNIFGKDGKINYLNYNSFLYDITTIEDEFGKFILPGKCLFDSEDNLNFINYWGEGYNGGKSDILDNFYSKYKQKNLDNEDIKTILAFINSKKVDGLNKDFKPFFGSMQLIIFYLANNNFNENKTIKSILEERPKYLKINDDCLEFFNVIGQNIKGDKIMNLFFLFEHLCFEDLCLNLPDIYKVKLTNENEIDEKLKALGDNINDKITMAQFGAAVRRFISRYLVGKKQKGNIIPNASLSQYLKKPELWEEKIAKLQNLGELVSDFINKFNIKVEQSYEFYMKIKEKDEQEISSFLKENEEIVDDNNQIIINSGSRKKRII